MWHPAAGHKGLFCSQGKCHGWELQTASAGRSRMKPRDGALLCYKGWRSHACLDTCRIKSSLSEKMLTCGNAGEWCSTHGFPAPRGKGCIGSWSVQLMQQKLPSIRTGVCHNSPGNLPTLRCGPQMCRHRWCSAMGLFTSISRRKLGGLFYWWLSWTLNACNAT